MASRRGGDARRDGGQSSVELALLLPVVVLLVLAILQVGVIARDVVLVTHAAREAARAAAVDPDPAAARAAAGRSSSLAADRMAIAVSPRGEPGTSVSVTVTYRAATSVPIVGAWLGDRSLRSTATMRIEGA